MQISWQIDQPDRRSEWISHQLRKAFGLTIAFHAINSVKMRSSITPLQELMGGFIEPADRVISYCSLNCGCSQ